MNPLNTSVSYFKRCKGLDAEIHSTINLLTFLRSPLHRQSVELVRAEPDKDKRDDLKVKLLPAITPVGVFSSRGAEHLVSYSGLLAGDIDFKENPYKAETIKAAVANISNVAYCGLSASGRGLWFLVPIAFPDRYKEHFTALAADFARLGIVLDPVPSSIASLRFYSFDPDAYFNPDAVTYSKLPAPKLERPKWTSTYTGSDSLARKAAQYLIDMGKTVALEYGDYEKITAACKYEFGDEGEAIAWAILENSPAFQVSKFRKNFAAHWRSFKREGGDVVTGGTLVYLAEKEGFEYRKSNATQSQPTPVYNIPERDCSTPKPTPPALPAGFERRTFTSQITGESLDVLLNPDGYPAAWDLTPPQREALTKAIATNPAVTDLIGRFDLRLESVNPLNN